MEILIGTIAFGGVIFTAIVFSGICFQRGIQPSVVKPESDKPETYETETVGFCRRQFQVEATKNQKIFDWMFGAILPVICFTFDPLVFKGNGALIGNYKSFAYLLSFISVMAISAWLIWGSKLKWLNAILAGIFGLSGVISLIIGICIFPISLLGLIVLIGALGFTPLFTSIVFLRNAVRAFHAAKPFLEKRVLVSTALLCALFSFTIPFVINAKIYSLLDEMETGNVQTIRQNARMLKFVAPIVNFDRLSFHYFRSSENVSPEAKQAIADAYRDLTGENIEKNARVLMD